MNKRKCKRCGAEMKAVKRGGILLLTCNCREKGFDGPPADKMIGSGNDKSQTVRK